MDTLQDKRTELEKRIVEVALANIEKETLTLDQATEITDFWLAKVADLESEEELLNFVKELATKWPIFDGIVLVEQGNVQKQEEVKVADNVVSLVKGGQIEEALDLAKSSTNNN
jgi:short-subunit dehydrogenase involved in D-alanine esterification of teichoic acids